MRPHRVQRRRRQALPRDHWRSIRHPCHTIMKRAGLGSAVGKDHGRQDIGPSARPLGSGALRSPHHFQRATPSPCAAGVRGPLRWRAASPRPGPPDPYRAICSIRPAAGGPDRGSSRSGPPRVRSVFDIYDVYLFVAIPAGSKRDLLTVGRAGDRAPSSAVRSAGTRGPAAQRAPCPSPAVGPSPPFPGV